MKIDVVTLDNEKAGSIELADPVFAAPVRGDILARVVNWQRAKRRAGTHNTKGISEIRGTTAKPYKQKGTGRARHGSRRSPQSRGGAVIFGPKPRSHAHKLPKKVRRLALRSALSSKRADGQLDRRSTPPGRTITRPPLSPSGSRARLAFGADHRRRRSSIPISPARPPTCRISMCCRSRAPTSTTSCAARRWC